MSYDQRECACHNSLPNYLHATNILHSIPITPPLLFSHKNLPIPKHRTEMFGTPWILLLLSLAALALGQVQNITNDK